MKLCCALRQRLTSPGSVRAGAYGYTYVGLMIFMAILALVSASVLSLGSSMQQRANEEELLFIGGQFAQAFRSYFEATPIGQRNYPSKLEELLRDSRYPGIRRHLRKVYVDPMTGRAEWGYVTAPNGIIGVHSLSRRAPLKVAQFEPAFAVLEGKTSYAEWAFGFVPPGVVPTGSVSLSGTVTSAAKMPTTKASPPPSRLTSPAPGPLGVAAPDP